VTTAPRVDYQTQPSQYKHWKLKFEGPVATLAADFDENAGLRPGYKLKLNSYDLGVDIELNDAVNRIRFEHPEVRTVVLTSAKEKVFCSGANIFMLGVSSHAWKVNFCKFTNETRNGLEDSSKYSGLKFLAAVNWRWPATRSSWSMTAPARSACLKCLCSVCCPAPAA
jgi:benzoyl-CoA-dihydrodiol lyase